jgi:N-acetylglucosaminyldiphosphoundecaprenol N-acetyl-beta-D-mannosaminyltransferase
MSSNASSQLRVGPLRVAVDATRRADARDEVVRRATEGTPTGVHLVNAYSLVCAHSHDEVAGALAAEADVNFMDGMPLVWLARAFGASPDISRVYGPDLMLDVLDRGRAHGLRHYLYGGTPRTLSLLRERLERRFPGVQIVGSEAPPFRPLDPHEVAAAQDRIRQSSADVVWVGLGTPKQDLLCTEWAAACDCVMVGVGAAFDFHAGVKRQAPQRMQRFGLEWLFRLCTEPRRLAGRYLAGNLRFLWLARRSELHPIAVGSKNVTSTRRPDGSPEGLTERVPRDGEAA